jgi:hypothetical protein
VFEDDFEIEILQDTASYGQDSQRGLIHHPISIDGAAHRKGSGSGG